MIVTLLAFIAIVTVLLLIANIGYVIDEEGEGILGPAGHIIAGRVAEILFVVWIILFAYFIFFNFGARRRRSDEMETGGGSSKYWPLGILVLVAFIVVLKWLSGNGDDSSNPGEPVDGGGGGLLPGTEGGGTQSYLIYIVTISILILVVYVVMKELWTKKHPAVHRSPSREVKGIIGDAVCSLEAGDDPRSVIYVSYLRMCRLLENRGLTDVKFMTPGEFAKVAVEEFGLPRDQVEELTRLFEEARYSDHSVGQGMKERSVRCLGAIKSSLDAEGGEGIGTAY